MLNSSCSNDVMSYLPFCVFPWIEKFILILIFFLSHLGVASEMFDVFCWKIYKMIPQNCHWKKLGDEVTKNWHNVKDTENELDCDSNDKLYLFSVFPIRSFQLHVNKHLDCLLQMYDGAFNLLGIQGRGCTSKFFCDFRSGSVDKVSLGTFSSQNHTPFKLWLMLK